MNVFIFKNLKVVSSSLLISTIRRQKPTSNSSINHLIHLGPCIFHLDWTYNRNDTTRRHDNIASNDHFCSRYLDPMSKTLNHYDNSDCPLKTQKQSIEREKHFLKNCMFLLGDIVKNKMS